MIAGSVLDIIGPRLTLICGITGYPLYIGRIETFRHVDGADTTKVDCGTLMLMDIFGSQYSQGRILDFQQAASGQLQVSTTTEV